jgi:hypothetical protein
MNIINYKEFKSSGEDNPENNIMQNSAVDLGDSLEGGDEVTKKMKKELYSIGTFAIVAGWFLVGMPLFLLFLLVFFVTFSLTSALFIAFSLIPGITGAITFIALGRRIKKGDDIKILSYLNTLRTICYMGLVASVVAVTPVLLFGGLIFFIICLTQISPAINVLKKGVQDDNFRASLANRDYKTNWLIKLATSITILCLSILVFMGMFSKLDTENLIKDDDVKRSETYSSIDDLEVRTLDVENDQRRITNSIRNRNKAAADMVRREREAISILDIVVEE